MPADLSDPESFHWLEQLPSGLLLYDATGQLRFCNRRGRELLAAGGAAELSGSAVGPLWQGLDGRPLPCQPVEQVLASGREWPAQTLTLPGPEPRPVFRVSAHPAQAPAGGGAQVLLGFEACDPPRPPELASPRLERLVRHLPELLFELRLPRHGRPAMPFASEALRTLFRLTPEQVREDADALLARVHPEDRTALTASLRRSARRRRPWQHEFRLRFDDGRVRWLSGQAMPERDADGGLSWYGVLRDISASKSDEPVFHGLFEQTTFLTGLLDRDGHLQQVNQKALDLLKAPREAMLGRYFPDTPWWRSQDRGRLLQALAQARAGRASSFEARHLGPQGPGIDVLVTAMPIHLGEEMHIAVLGIDISAHKRAERAFHASEHRFRDFFEKNRSVMMLIDPGDGRILDANLSAARYYGYPLQRLRHMNIAAINTLPAEQVALERARALAEERNSFEFRHRLADGEERDVEVYVTPIRTVEGELLFTMVNDITERKRLQQQVSALAYFDPLTSLPNRRMLNDRLAHALATIRRKGGAGALMFLDLDNFKSLNDRHGHEAGDLLLQEVARRTVACVRDTDTVARLGGDEFIVLLSDLPEDAGTARHDALAVAEKIRLQLAQPYDIVLRGPDTRSRHVLHRCTASIGLVAYQAPLPSQEDLLKQADQAMYAAKSEGRDRVHLGGPAAPG